MRHRAGCVRKLKVNDRSIYCKGWLYRALSEQCNLFSVCQYLDQFRRNVDDIGIKNAIHIYTQASLFFAYNEHERQITPDLVIMDPAFVYSAVSNMTFMSVNDIIHHVRLPNKKRNLSKWGLPRRISAPHTIAKNRRTYANMGGALSNRALKIATHPHGQAIQSVARRDLCQ